MENVETHEQPKVGDYITVIDVTKILPVSRAQVYNMVKRNELKSYRFGKKILFKKDEVMEQLSPKEPVVQ